MGREPASTWRGTLWLCAAFAAGALLLVGAVWLYLDRTGDPPGTTRLTGTVDAAISLGGRPTVLLNLGGGNDAHCVFAEAAPPGFDGLRSGMRATIRGRVTQNLPKFVRLDDCEIVSAR